jgi:hypothetical protein
MVGEFMCNPILVIKDGSGNARACIAVRGAILVARPK